MATATQQKVLGAFYTSDPVAKFLVEWAIRSPNDTVLDPSCGDGVFLAAASERLLQFGNRAPGIWGVDVDPEALRASLLRSPGSRFIEGSFFSLRARDIPPVTTVVGNPPFIRYQTFNGEQRSQALASALDAGVKLPQLCSSWAPFVVHASKFLQNGGRLAMVVPSEFIHAQYAREVLRYLLRSFRRITVRMFRTKLFQALSEDTLLLLCEDFGNRCRWCSITPDSALEEATQTDERAIPVDLEAVEAGRHRLTRYLLPPKVRHLYENLSGQDGVTRLGDAADIGIGYVTGANDYFHLTATDAARWRIPSAYLRPAVLSLGDFHGTVFRKSDWEQRLQTGEKAYLLRIEQPTEKALRNGLSAYLAYGKKQGFQTRFKCRVRENWFAVPHVRVGDAFLSYMSGGTPKLVRNSAGLVAPNTLHIVCFSRGFRWTSFLVGWQSSLTKLSCEIEGHALGGGLLKLEPTEAENVRIALPNARDAKPLVGELDELLRRNKISEATNLVDTIVLRRRFALSKSECDSLGDAARQLFDWRMHK